MKIIKFDGSPEEFKAIAYLFDDVPSPGPNGDNGQHDEPETDPNKVKEAYRAMLKRREISQGQLDMFQVLAEGELEYSDYLSKMERDVAQIRGLHGALGNRINNTPEIKAAGLPGNMSAISTAWEKRGDEWYIALKEDFLEVLREENII